MHCPVAQCLLSQLLSFGLLDQLIDFKLHAVAHADAEVFAIVGILADNVLDLIGQYDKELTKNSQEIIKNHQAFFNGLADIDQIIVIGHSMGEVDIPYFEEILKHINRDCIWHFYWHATDEQGRFYQLIHNEPFKGFFCRIHQI